MSSNKLVNDGTEKDLPKVVSDVDKLNIEVLLERSSKLGAQKQLLELQLKVISADIGKVNDDYSKIMMSVKNKYLLKDDDTIDINTGVINRKSE